MALENGAYPVSRHGVRISIPRLAATLLDVGILVAWGWLISPSLNWVVRSLAQPSTRLNLVLVLAAIGVLAWRTRRQGALQLRLQFRALPLAILILSGLAFVTVEYGLDINRIGVAAAGLGTYGLAGLYLPRPQWRRLLAPWLLLLALLPFAEQLDIYLGFPLRLLTAELVGNLLHAGGAADITTQTILVFENGVAQVDLPCSGVKSLWAGGVLSLAVTWLDDKRLGISWLLSNLGFFVLLVLGNATRVLILVLVGIVLERPFLADVLHAPLGLMVLAIASILLLACMRLSARPRAVSTKTPLPSKVGDTGRAPRKCLLYRALLVGSLVVMACAHTRRPAPSQDDSGMALSLPTGVDVESIALTDVEQRHFHDQGASFVQKVRFSWGDLEGSLLVVQSESFRAHHLPDRCITASGLTIAGRHTLLVEPDFPVRHVELEAHPGAAYYWFQSKKLTTEDYSARVWADISGHERSWVLVSVIIDQLSGSAHPPELFLLLHDAVQASLLRGS
ncbi:exosortase O [Myxococcota bacterium]